MRKSRAEELGLTWLAEIGAHGVVAGPDSTLQSQPARAIAKACEREGIAPTDLDLVEINEAFAAVGLASAKELGLDARQGQRQRRRHRPRPPDRHVRCPHHAPPRPRAAAPRRRGRCGGALRRWRPGRRPRRPGPRAGLTRTHPDRAARVDVPSLVASAREGRPRAVARLISLVEDGHPALREVMAAHRAGCRSRARRRRHRGARRREVDDDERAGRRRTAPRGRRVGVLAVDPSSPFSGGALLGDRIRMSEHAGRPGRVHPLDGLARPPRRAVVGGPAGAAGARRRRLRRRAARDRRRRPVRGRGGRHRRHDRRAARARDGRRHPGGQGRHPRGRRRARRQQGRPRGRRPHRARPAARRPARGRTRRTSGWRVPVVRTVATDGTGVEDLVAGRRRHRAWLGDDGLRGRRVRRAAAGDRGARPRGGARAGRRCCAATPGSRRSPTRWSPGAPTRTPRPTGSRPRSAERVRSLRDAVVRHDGPVPAVPDLTTPPLPDRLPVAPRPEAASAGGPAGG